MKRTELRLEMYHHQSEALNDIETFANDLECKLTGVLFLLNQKDYEGAKALVVSLLEEIK